MSAFYTRGYDQYLGVQMQKNSEKGHKLRKIAQCALFRSQSGAGGKILRNNV